MVQEETIKWQNYTTGTNFLKDLFKEKKEMRKSGILQTLAAVESTDKPFISIYLNAEPNEHGRDDFNIFLKKQLSVHEGRFAEESPELESYKNDVKKIQNYVEKIPASADGVAIFACDAEDYFKTFEFDVAFEEHRFEIMDRPHIYPLARLVDQNPQFAVVLADLNETRIYLMQRGRIINSEEIENEKYTRSEAGGWSQMRYQRRIDEMRKQNAKEVINELEKLVRDEDIRQIVLAGNKDVVIPILIEQMDDFLSEKVVGTTRMEIDTPEHEIIDKAEFVINRFDTLQDKEKIDQLKELNYAEGKGITGVVNTLKALANGQVQELYLTATFDEIEYDENSVKEILDAYAPAEDGEMPSAKNSHEIADEMIIRALESAERIRFIEDENLLEEFGGAGALLRYTMSANQNQT